jgi:hypothetical protein
MGTADICYRQLLYLILDHNPSQKRKYVLQILLMDMWNPNEHGTQMYKHTDFKESLLFLKIILSNKSMEQAMYKYI